MSFLKSGSSLGSDRSDSHLVNASGRVILVCKMSPSALEWFILEAVHYFFILPKGTSSYYNISRHSVGGGLGRLLLLFGFGVFWFAFLGILLKMFGFLLF
jgi:hypothetical protein